MKKTTTLQRLFNKLDRYNLDFFDPILKKITDFVYSSKLSGLFILEKLGFESSNLIHSNGEDERNKKTGMLVYQAVLKGELRTYFEFQEKVFINPSFRTIDQRKQDLRDFKGYLRELKDLSFIDRVFSVRKKMESSRKSIFARHNATRNPIAE